MSSKAFIIIFFLASYILLLYTAAATSSYTFTIDKPSLLQYAQLHQRYPQTLTCPCSQIANKYGTFVTLDYSRHPICRSVFVTDQWIEFVGLYPGFLWTIDIRYTARYMFEGLRSFCQLTEESLSIGLEQFYSTSHVTDVVSSEELLQSQVGAIAQEFIDSTTNDFLLSLQIIKNTTQANGLVSVLQTNSWFLLNNQSIYLDVLTLMYGDDCRCPFSSECIGTAAIYEESYLTPTWYVPGLYNGCFILEALRRSNLRCFYDQYCLQDLIINLKINQSVTHRALDASSMKQFEMDTQIGTIVDALMVDEWKANVSHAKYYGMCHPSECTYTITTRNSWLGIVTTMVGLIGGLVTALRIAIPRIVHLIRSRCKRRTSASSGKIFVLF